MKEWISGGKVQNFKEKPKDLFGFAHSNALKTTTIEEYRKFLKEMMKKEMMERKKIVLKRLSSEKQRWKKLKMRETMEDMDIEESV